MELQRPNSIHIRKLSDQMGFHDDSKIEKINCLNDKIMKAQGFDEDMDQSSIVKTSIDQTLDDDKLLQSFKLHLGHSRN